MISFKRLISKITAALILLTSMSSLGLAEPEKPNLVAESAILIDGDTGQVLFEKNSDKAMYPASTTKILTCIVALENSKPGDKVTVDDKTPFEIEGSHIALEPKEVLTMDQLLNALMLESANDAAVVIAKHIGGSVEGFSKMMNQKAKEIGAKNTNFENPNGLENTSHVTTAYDLAMIARYGMKNENFRKYVSKVSDTIPPTNIKKEQRYLNNSNKMLFSDALIDVDGKQVPAKYEGITGIKTGYTDVAMHCLVSSAKRNDKEYIAVVLKTDKQNLYADSHRLLNYGFDNFKYKIVAKKNDIIGVTIDGRSVKARIKEDVHYDQLAGETASIETKISVDGQKQNDYMAGEKIGKITYLSGGKEFANTALYATENSLEGTLTQIADDNGASSALVKTLLIVIAVLLFLVFLILFRIVHVASVKRRRKRRLN